MLLGILGAFWRLRQLLILLHMTRVKGILAKLQRATMNRKPERCLPGLYSLSYGAQCSFDADPLLRSRTSVFSILLPVPQIATNGVLVDEARVLVDSREVDLSDEVDDWWLLGVLRAAHDLELVDSVLKVSLI